MGRGEVVVAEGRVADEAVVLSRTAGLLGDKVVFNVRADVVVFDVIETEVNGRDFGGTDAVEAVELPEGRDIGALDDFKM